MHAELPTNNSHNLALYNVYLSLPLRNKTHFQDKSPRATNQFGTFLKILWKAFHDTFVFAVRAPKAQLARLLSGREKIESLPTSPSSSSYTVVGPTELLLAGVHTRARARSLALDRRKNGRRLRLDMCAIVERWECFCR